MIRHHVRFEDTAVVYYFILGVYYIKCSIKDGLCKYSMT